MGLESLNVFFTAEPAFIAAAASAFFTAMAALAAFLQCEKMKEIAESSNKTLLFEKRFEDYSSLKKILITARTQEQTELEWGDNIWSPLGIILSRSKFLFGDEVHNWVKDLNQIVQNSRMIFRRDRPGYTKNTTILSEEERRKESFELDESFKKKLDEIEKVFSPYLKIFE